MANRTDKEAYAIHGTNPQVCRGGGHRQLPADHVARCSTRNGFAAAAVAAAGLLSRTSSLSLLPPSRPAVQNLIEYISRQKIYDSVYWKQECFGLSAERLVDKAVEIKEVRFGQIC